MRSVRRALLAAIATTAVACTTPSNRTLPAPQEPAGQPGPPANAWGDRMMVEAMVMPAVWLKNDSDNFLGDEDESDGYGYGVRAAVGNLDQSVGLLYQGFDCDQDALDVQTLSLDFDVRTPFDDGSGKLFLRAGAGVGIAWFDTVAGSTLGTETSAQLRLGVDFQTTEHLMVGVELGGIVFGHPGETEAYGTFVTLAATWTF